MPQFRQFRHDTQATHTRCRVPEVADEAGKAKAVLQVSFALHIELRKDALSLGHPLLIETVIILGGPCDPSQVVPWW